MPLPLEILVRLHAQRDEEIAGRATTRRRLALARHPDGDAVVHAGGNIDRHPAHVADTALALAALAGRGDHAALATAAVADHHVDELAEDRLLHAANLAGALAGWGSAVVFVPGCAPLPWQVGQVSQRGISISFWQPFTASSKEIVRS